MQCEEANFLASFTLSHYPLVMEQFATVWDIFFSMNSLHTMVIFHSQNAKKTALLEPPIF